MRTNNFPSLYPRALSAAVDTLLTSVQAILGPQLVGDYLHGSLASGDFNPATSDIDFLVATRTSLPPETFAALASMHASLFASGIPWADKLEGAYMPLAALRRYDSQAAPHPWLGVDGHFAMECTGADWVIQRHILREHGIVLLGPDPRTLIDPVTPAELRQAVIQFLQGWWSSPFPSPARFDSSEYQAYAVLTMCRALYTLQTSAIASKPAAARWAQQTLPSPWPDLIQWAMDWQPEEQMDRKDEVMRFILYTLEHETKII